MSSRVGRSASFLRPVFFLFFSLFWFTDFCGKNHMLANMNKNKNPAVLSFPAISVASINCNSLNVSTITSYHQTLKIHGIVQLKTDIILLSDIRLGKKADSHTEVIKKMFLTNPYCSYDFLHNSSSNSRGVGILIRSNLNFRVLAEARDSNDNILALRAQHLGTEFILCAVYGPNFVCDDFFSDLNKILNTYSNLPVIMGGDWNCTPSANPLKKNPDVINMVSLPNLTHSKQLAALMEKFELCDIYRCYNPVRSDFTFIPKCKERKNRSRIDFILISDSIVKFSHSSDISPGVPNSLFDHKSVFVNFFKNKIPGQRTAIAASVLKDPLVGLLVQASAIECYLHHSLISDVEKNSKLGIIGNIRRLIKLAGPDPYVNNIIGWNDDKELNRDNTIAEIVTLLDNFNISELETMELNIEDDYFLEFFVNCIRNDVASYQIFCSKTTNETKNTLIAELNYLRSRNSDNQNLISIKENALNSILDTEMKNEFEKLKHFDILNSEKITPSFLKILRGSSKGAKLCDILDEDGNNFLSEEERINYIVEFFKKIYTKPPSEPSDMTGCINNFLGPEISEHPIVKDCILTKTEKMRLDVKFKIDELDCAIKDANMNSAAGIDGLSTKFISKFWTFFRVPLFKYANCCFRKGSLTDTFKSATIRLIPKKGDVRNIKNWRPISLLSNLYKILSRALNNRLLTTTDRVTSRAQKGFTKSRYLQEVLINVLQFIGNCENAGVSAFVLSIDYAKAFDTLSINFMKECYKFFGFGDTFINMLVTVGNMRTASIILDDGSYSKQFNLECGRPQGENLSPGQYNIANQIMLFRLELDPKFKSVFQHFLIPKFNFNPPGIDSSDNLKFRCESLRQTENTEGFADDTSFVGELTSDNVKYISTILDEFAHFSGLRCNFDKTLLIPVGAEPAIFDHGRFTVATEFTLLGMKIDSKLEKILNNFDNAIEKMLKIAQFWVRLHLSLPGRIAIAKTFLLSQINHIGCILMPSKTQLNRMQEIVDGFCLGNIKFAKEKLYLPPKKGGMGLINIAEFLTAQHIMWFKRAAQSTRDNWRVDLCRLGYGNPFTVSHLELVQKQHPVLFGLCASFDTFRTAYCEIENNYKHAFILNNMIFRRGVDDDRPLNSSFFGGKDNADLINIAKIRYWDCWAGSKFVSRLALNSKFHCNISEAVFFRLRSALTIFKNRKKNSAMLGESMPIGNFLRSFKKGSIHCRKILQKNTNCNVCLTKSDAIITFFDLLSVQLPEVSDLENVSKLWCKTALPNSFREFLFKFFNNRLGLNVRTHHFGGDTRYCTFCLIDNNPTTDETFEHLFFSCPVVKHVHCRIMSTALGLENNDDKKIFWFGFPTGQLKNTFYCLFFLSIQYFIWRAKLCNKLPDINYIFGETVQLLDKLSKLNYKVFVEKDNFNCILSRSWSLLRARRW